MEQKWKNYIITELVSVPIAILILCAIVYCIPFLQNIGIYIGMFIGIACSVSYRAYKLYKE
jgi:uncharacterized membrane protein